MCRANFSVEDESQVNSTSLFQRKGSAGHKTRYADRAKGERDKMASVLIAIPLNDFDPTEVSVPWSLLKAAGHSVFFATPDGSMGAADPVMLTGRSLGIWKLLLRAEPFVLPIYERLKADTHFQKPMSYADARNLKFDVILLPGGHAAGIRPYLESTILQELIARQDARGGLIAAICHGVVLVGRSQASSGKSVLFGKKTTALLKSQELLAWTMTRLWLGHYYRTYPETTVQDEVRSYLEKPEDFLEGPLPLARDRNDRLERGFVVQDRHYISARWPGDAHRFARAIIDALRDQVSI